MVPAKVQIMDAVGQRLALITAANGYLPMTSKAGRPPKIERARRTPWNDGDLPAINYWPDEDRLVERGIGFETRELDFFIEAHNATRDQPFTNLSATMGAYLSIALWRSPAAPQVTDPPSSALGGLIQSLALNGEIPAIGEGGAPFCGVLLHLTATYKIRPEDPFTLIP